jgi:hypothetical protein
MVGDSPIHTVGRVLKMVELVVGLGALAPPAIVGKQPRVRTDRYGDPLPPKK